jgi:Acetyltransferase (GNAT) domain
MAARWLERAKAFLYEKYSEYFSHSLLVEGTLKYAPRTCRVLLVMPRYSTTRSYLLHLLFGVDFKTIRSGRVFILQLRSYLKNLPDDVGLVFVLVPTALDGSFSQTGGIKSPGEVRQIIDLTGDMSELKARFRTRTKGIFNKYSQRTPFSIRLSNDLGDFDFFFHRMLVPHLHRQFKGFAEIDDYRKLLPYFQKGFLFVAREEDQDVAATLCYVKGDTMTYHRAGVLDGEERHIKSGAQSALYVHMITHARSMGLAKLDLGLSDAFFDDGVYNYKRSWGAGVSVDEDAESSLYIYSHKDSKELVHFLHHHPLIGWKDGALVGHVGELSESPDEKVDDQALQRKLGASGLSGFLVHRATADPPRFSLSASASDP